MANVGVSASWMRQREEEARDAAALLTRCSLCEWSYQGTALEGRERAVRHRQEAHPDLRPKRRRQTRGLSTFRYPPMSEEHAEEILLERSRRMRLLGIEET